MGTINQSHSACRLARVTAFGLLLGLSALAGCSTHVDYLRQVRAEFYAGNVAQATATIDRRSNWHANDADVLHLERAIVDLSAGRVREAEKALRAARDRFDYLEQKSLTESALVMLSDDNAASYAGEDYEKVLVRALLSLSNLLGDGGDAAAYALQVMEKQDQIVQSGKDESGNNPKLNYKHVALGAYLHGAILEESHMNFDDAARAFVQVVSWEPGYRPGPADVQRAKTGCHSARGNGVVYVFTLVGRGPYKEQVMELPSTVSLLIADRIISALGKHSLPPTIAPIRVPKVVLSLNNVRSVQVLADGRPCGNTETITDVGQMAVEQYEAVYPRVIARAVVRRALKKGIVYGAKEAIHAERSPYYELALDAAGVVWEALESADTRCWGLLPAQIQVLRLELPAGEHALNLRAMSVYGAIGPDYTRNIQVADGRNTYVLANFPDARLVGEMSVSQR